MKIKVITDIHGQFDKLNKALKQIKKDQYDKLIFLGDYFDRAPKEQQKKMMKYVVKHYNDLDKIFLLGNHDLWLKKHLNNTLKLSDYQIWNMKCNGGGGTWDAAKEMKIDNPKTLNKLKDILNEMKYYHIINKHIFTHAGVDWTLDQIIATDDDIWGNSFYKIINAKSENNNERLNEFFNSRSDYFKDKIFVLGHYNIPLLFRYTYVQYRESAEQDLIRIMMKDYLPFNIRDTIYLNDTCTKYFDVFVGEYNV